MTAQAMSNQAGAVPVESPTFERFGGLCAILAGVAGFVYAVAFIILRSDGLSALCLLLVGLFTTAALPAAYLRLRETDAGFALWALLLGIAGALGSAVHGGYDLANAINPPAATNADLPNQVDPRGLLTFGVAGVALFAVAWLIGRGRGAQFPLGLGYLGYVAAALLVILYLGRLIILDAKSPAIVVPALPSGFLVNPAWYVWLGLELWRGRGYSSRVLSAES